MSKGVNGFDNSSNETLSYYLPGKAAQRNLYTPTQTYVGDNKKPTVAFIHLPTHFVPTGVSGPAGAYPAHVGRRQRENPGHVTTLLSHSHNLVSVWSNL